MELVILGRFFFCMGLALTIEAVTAVAITIAGHHDPTVLLVYAIGLVTGVIILVLSVLMMLKGPPGSNGPRKQLPLESSYDMKTANLSSFVRRFFFIPHWCIVPDGSPLRN